MQAAPIDEIASLPISGVFSLPFDIAASGIFTAQSGSTYTALDPAVGFHNHPGFAVGPHGAQTRAVADGALASVNGERNAPWTNIDLRVTRRFQLGGTRVEGFFRSSSNPPAGDLLIPRGELPSARRLRHVSQEYR